MKRLFIALVFLTLASPSAAALDTANQLLSACEQLERTMRMSGDNIYLGPNPDSHMCWGYLSAIQDISVFAADARGRTTLLGICAPPESDLVQFIRIFLSYSRAHPEELHQRAGTVVVRALQNVFPCPR